MSHTLQPDDEVSPDEYTLRRGELLAAPAIWAVASVIQTGVELARHRPEAFSAAEIVELETRAEQLAKMAEDWALTG